MGPELNQSMVPVFGLDCPHIVAFSVRIELGWLLTFNHVSNFLRP